MSAAGPRGFFYRRLGRPLLDQLTQGVSPRALAFTLAVGGVLAIFPILGSTTLLCLVFGVLFRLNQPVLQALNYLLYPLQIALIPAFIRLGERLFLAPPVPIHPAAMVREFTQSPAEFFKLYGAAGLHGIAAWTLCAPLLALVIFYPAAYICERVRRQFAAQTQQPL